MFANVYLTKHDPYHARLVNFFITLTIYSGLRRIIDMRYLSQQITFQEVPDEISLSFLITGCSLKCKGCHSADSWNPAKGQILNAETLAGLIQKYRSAVTCILFMGGEWQQQELVKLLRVCRKYNLKTCLYTGLNDVNSEIKKELTFLKTGGWDKDLGGLSSQNTNQRLTNLETGKVMNFHFTALNAQGGQHGETYGRSGQQKDGFYQSLPTESQRRRCLQT